jgi:hypothetical protein
MRAMDAGRSVSLDAFKKKHQQDELTTYPAVRPGFGSVPGILLVDDFDAPLEAFC